MSEPDIYVCSILDDKTAFCVPTDKTKPEFDLLIKDMTGYFCTSNQDFGEIKKHHDELHKRLEDKKK